MLELLAKKTYQSGMDEALFWREIYAETSIIIAMQMESNRGKSREEVCRGKISKLLQDIKSGCLQPRVADVLNNLYNARRLADFPEDGSNLAALRLKQMRDGEGVVDLINQDKWCFRFPKNRHQQGWSSNDKSVERLVVNALPDQNIIKVLDEFCAANKCGYKCPPAEDFSTRVDTVVVYAYAPLTDEVKDNFVKIMSPFVRKTLPERTNDLDGQLLAEGISFAKEMSKTELAQYVENIQQTTMPEVGSGIIDYLKKPGSSELKMSLGQKYVIKHFLSVKNELFENKENDVLKYNTVFFDKARNYAVFQPKNEAVKMQAYQSLKTCGLEIELGSEREKSGRLFEANLAHPKNQKAMQKILSPKILQKPNHQH